MQKQFIVSVDEDIIGRVINLITRWKMTKSAFAQKAMEDMVERMENQTPPWEGEGHNE